MTLFAVLDLETTGLDYDADKILEIAWTITDENFAALSPARTHIVHHAPDQWADVWGQLRANDYVRNMHQESGLLNDMRAKVAWPMSAAMLQFRDDVVSARREEDENVHFAGLSVGFDRSFLERDPDFNLLITTDMFGFQMHHRLADLSSVKLLLESFGVPFEKAPNIGAHRAINDVQEVITQAKLFKALTQPLVPSNGNKTNEEVYG